MINSLNVFGTVRISQSCRFKIFMYCLDRKSNTGAINRQFAMSREMSFGAVFEVDFSGAVPY